MIKDGFTLYATKANGRWFIKQARNPRHFVQLCCKDEESTGWFVQPKFRHYYDPSFRYDEKLKAWVDLDDGSLRTKLPRQ